MLQLLVGKPVDSLQLNQAIGVCLGGSDRSFSCVLFVGPSPVVPCKMMTRSSPKGAYSSSTRRALAGFFGFYVNLATRHRQDRKHSPKKNLILVLTRAVIYSVTHSEPCRFRPEPRFARSVGYKGDVGQLWEEAVHFFRFWWARLLIQNASQQLKEVFVRPLQEEVLNKCFRMILR